MKIPDVEYASLRQELITRITLLNNQSQTAGVAIISTWTAGIAIRVGMFRAYEAFRAPEIILAGLMASLFFLIPILYFIPLSVKSGENITQIASISAYIRVFCEYPSKNSESAFNWETSNSLMSYINVERDGRKGFVMKRYNGDYSILALCSLVIYIINATVDIIINSRSMITANTAKLIIIYGLFGLVGVASIVFIHSVSSAKKTLMDRTPEYIKGYIMRGIEMGVFERDDIVKVWESLNPKNSIDLKKFDELLKE